MFNALTLRKYVIKLQHQYLETLLAVLVWYFRSASCYTGPYRRVKRGLCESVVIASTQGGECREWKIEEVIHSQTREHLRRVLASSSRHHKVGSRSSRCVCLLATAMARALFHAPVRLPTYFIVQVDSKGVKFSVTMNGELTIRRQKLHKSAELLQRDPT